MAGEHFGTDLAVDDRGDVLVAAGGDVALVSGVGNLVQALRLRLATPRGGLWKHAEYGCDVLPYLSGDDTPTNRTAVAQEVEAACEDDPRVDTARAQVVELGRDSIRVSVALEVVEDTNALNLVLGYGVDEVTLEVARG